MQRGRRFRSRMLHSKETFLFCVHPDDSAGTSQLHSEDHSNTLGRRSSRAHLASSIASCALVRRFAAAVVPPPPPPPPSPSPPSSSSSKDSSATFFFCFRGRAAAAASAFALQHAAAASGTRCPALKTEAAPRSSVYGAASAACTVALQCAAAASEKGVSLSKGKQRHLLLLLLRPCRRRCLRSSPAMRHVSVKDYVSRSQTEAARRFSSASATAPPWPPPLSPCNVERWGARHLAAPVTSVCAA